MRKFAILLNEWFCKNQNDFSDIGRAIKKLTFQQDEGKQNTIQDVKNWILWKGLEDNEDSCKDLCPCFLTIWKYLYYDNIKKSNVIAQCNYYDNTFLDNTEFNENNPMYISFDKSRQCYCGKIQEINGMKYIFSKRLEVEKKNIQDDFNRKTEEMSKNYRDKLNQMNNDFKDKIQQQKYENIELKNEIKMKNLEHEKDIQRMNQKNDEAQEKIQLLDQSLREIDEKEKTLIQSKINAENEYNKSYQEIFSNYYKNEKDTLIQEISKDMKNFILNKLSFDDLLEEIIPKIAKKEKFSKCIREFMEEKINSIRDENLDFNVSHFNILIMGNTGVGKSTLLNRILKEPLAKTDFGGACTQGKPKSYESNSAKGIRIWDTKGIEQGNYNINKANFDIEEAIDNLVKENDPDKFIHCIWYCVHSNRFITEEIENIKKCYDFYVKKLPIIIIFTQSFNQEDSDKMIKYIKNELESGQKEDDINIKILKVLAEDKKTDNGIIKAFGISNLMKETCESVKQGIDSSCIESLMNQGEKLLKEEFDEIIQNLKKYFFNENLELDLPNLSDKEHFNILNEIINKDDDSPVIFDNFDSTSFTKFVSQFSKKLAENILHKEKMDKQSLFDLINIMTTKTNDIKNNFEEIFDKKLNDASNTLADTIDELTHELDSSHNISYLASKYGHSKLKLQSKNNIIENLKSIIEDHIYREASKILYDTYAEKFSQKMLEIFHDSLNGEDKKLENIFFDKGQETAEKIYNKIVKFLDYPNDDYIPKKKKVKNIKEKLNQRNKEPKNTKKEKTEEEEEEDEDDD